MNHCERLRAGAPPEKKKKVYADLDARLKTVTLSYNIADIEDYLNRIAMNLKIGVKIILNKFYFILSL